MNFREGFLPQIFGQLGFEFIQMTAFPVCGGRFLPESRVLVSVKREGLPVEGELCALEVPLFSHFI